MSLGITQLTKMAPTNTRIHYEARMMTSFLLQSKEEKCVNAKNFNLVKPPAR